MERPALGWYADSSLRRCCRRSWQVSARSARCKLSQWRLHSTKSLSTVGAAAGPCYVLGRYAATR